MTRESQIFDLRQPPFGSGPSLLQAGRITMEQVTINEYDIKRLLQAAASVFRALRAIFGLVLCFLGTWVYWAFFR